MADKFIILILVLFNSWAMAAEALPNRFDYDQENGKVHFQIDDFSIEEKETFYKISVEGRLISGPWLCEYSHMRSCPLKPMSIFPLTAYSQRIA